MNLKQALDFANKTAEWISPHCHRVEIAGSIRRARPHPNDIDLVVIPHRSETKDFFGKVILSRVPLIAHLNEYVAKTDGTGFRRKDGEPPDRSPVSESEPRQNLLVKIRLCDLDIFFATEETFGSVLLCRTGSVRHNIFVIETAKKAGLEWKPMRGLFEGSKLVASRTEKEILDALNLGWIEPERRER